MEKTIKYKWKNYIKIILYSFQIFYSSHSH